jgi:hypothetical protein
MEESTKVQAPNSTSVIDKSLWEKAFDQCKLSEDERSALSEVLHRDCIHNSDGAISELRGTIDGLIEKKQKSTWKFQFRGEEIVMRNIGYKALHWIDSYKSVGDIVSQVNPMYIGLPWAAFRFILQV